MKAKHIWELSLAISLALCLVACSSTPTPSLENTETDTTALQTPSDGFQIYESVVEGYANSGIGITQEHNVWTGLYFVKPNMPEKSCVVEGKEYIGQYQESIVDKLNSYTTDIYKDENQINFGLRSDTQELVLFNRMNRTFFDTEPFLPDIDHPAEYAQSYATELAKTYIDDIDNYEMSIRDPVVRQEEKDGQTHEITYYWTTFARKINGYYTSDYITVRTTSKGHMASMIMGDINAFANIEFDIDRNSLEESITNKIQNVYKDTGFVANETHFSSQKIVITPSGDICMYSTI